MATDGTNVATPIAHLMFETPPNFSKIPAGAASDRFGIV